MRRVRGADRAGSAAAVQCEGEAAGLFDPEIGLQALPQGSRAGTPGITMRAVAQSLGKIGPATQRLFGQPCTSQSATGGSAGRPSRPKGVENHGTPAWG